VIAALSPDPQLLGQSGRALIAAQRARDFHLRDVDVEQPAPLTPASV
jgi:hypothetical protein